MVRCDGFTYSVFSNILIQVLKSENFDVGKKKENITGVFESTQSMLHQNHWLKQCSCHHLFGAHVLVNVLVCLTMMFLFGLFGFEWILWLCQCKKFKQLFYECQTVKDSVWDELLAWKYTLFWLYLLTTMLLMHPENCLFSLRQTNMEHWFCTCLLDKIKTIRFTVHDRYAWSGFLVSYDKSWKWWIDVWWNKLIFNYEELLWTWTVRFGSRLQTSHIHM